MTNLHGDWSDYEGVELTPEEVDWLNQTRPTDPTPLRSPYSLYMTKMSRNALHLIFYDDLREQHSGRIHQSRFARFIYSVTPHQAIAMAQSLLHSAQVAMAHGMDYTANGEEVLPPEPFDEDAFHKLWPQLYGEHVPEVGPLPPELRAWLPDAGEDAAGDAADNE